MKLYLNSKCIAFLSTCRGFAYLLTNICHGFVSAGDALGRERPATPMSSFLARHSRPSASPAETKL